MALRESPLGQLGLAEDPGSYRQDRLCVVSNELSGNLSCLSAFHRRDLFHLGDPG